MADASHSKLDLDGGRIAVPEEQATLVLTGVFRALGFPAETGRLITDHLVDASLSGVESHGIMRVLEYAEQVRSGHIDPVATPRLDQTPQGAVFVDGGGGHGIPAMHLAYAHAADRAAESGLSAIAIRNAAHTGRHGAYAERAADKGFLTICIGGGNRFKWRQVAPFGGARAKLPTNPWCVGMPGGDGGPVVLDFATSKIAGGWLYAARSAGARLPDGCVIDRDGRPTRDPEDYFDGGAILPFGEHKGYAMALMAELIAEAMLGPAQPECHWLVLAIDTARYRGQGALAETAEEILADIRSCPPAPGFERVEIPGERERNHKARAAGRIAVPAKTWEQIGSLAASFT